jgi:hypothetical protein
LRNHALTAREMKVGTRKSSNIGTYSR